MSENTALEAAARVCKTCGYRNTVLFMVPTCCAPTSYRMLNLPCAVAYNKHGPCGGGGLWIDKLRESVAGKG
jgi:hypothetical protein